MRGCPFEGFVSSLFDSRLEARRSGNDALAYVYKILMNSLYGRLGINPRSTVTEVCKLDRYNHLIRNSELLFGEMLSENYYIVSYLSNTGKVSDSDYWNPPKISAVQLAAAITASARIYMYPYISREDCYYTDTDSVVLGKPLPEEEINSTLIGKFKLEHKVMKEYFLAPKSYSLITEEGANVLKHKGPAKALISQEWFESQYAAQTGRNLRPKVERKVPVSANFRIDWHTLNITKKETLVSLGIKEGNKRVPVYHRDVWVDTDPIEVTDLSSLNNIGKVLIKSLRHEVLQLQTENARILDQLAEKERELAAEKDKDRRDKENAIILENDAKGELEPKVEEVKPQHCQKKPKEKVSPHKKRR